MFLICVFLALGVTFSFPLFFVFHKKTPGFVDMRVLYRKSLKWGMFLSSGIVGVLILKSFDLLNLLNFGLFLLLYTGIFYQIKSKR